MARIATLVGLLISSCVFAQDRLLYVRGGASLFVAENKPGGDLIFFPGITVAPGLRLMNGERFALSLSAPISVGGSGRNVSYFGFDAPVMFDISLGSAAGNPDSSDFGIIMGAGLAYMYAENVAPTLVMDFRNSAQQILPGLVLNLDLVSKRKIIIVHRSFCLAMAAVGHPPDKDLAEARSGPATCGV